MAHPSVMEHSFSEVPRADIPRSSFDRSHGLKTSLDADWLVPIFVDDVIPGDTFNCNVTHYARLGSPALHPIMDNLFLETFFFFVPYRLVWDNWEKFVGSQEDPGDSIDYTIPALSSNTSHDTTGGTTVDQLLDYMGLPYAASVDLTEFHALPFRAMNLIWNEWFRDQNLQDSVNVLTGAGPDNLTGNYNLLKRGKRADYFTSSLPWPQKGGAVALPLTGNAPIVGLGMTTTNSPSTSGTAVETGGSSETYPFYMETSSTPGLRVELDSASNAEPLIYANLSAVTAATVNDLRLAFQTQRLLERDARSGTRYVETLLAHYGVTVPDFRLQRPEFLGGGSSQVAMHEVPNTSDTASREQGELSAFGTSSGQHGFTKSFVEHGVILGFANLRGDITYSQGSERYWFKQTRYEFYYPVLSQIGEQEVLNREIFYQNNANDEAVWGYQERYAEYRYKPSRLTGLFRPDHTSTLASWHLSEDFASLPTLGDTFIKSNTGAPLDRALTVPSEPHMLIDFYFDLKCARPMPMWGVPGNLDHF